MPHRAHPARRVAVVGAGPAGTTLALGLAQRGHAVTLVSDRSPEQIRTGPVMSSQITFESALEVEAALGVTHLVPEAPPIPRMSYDAHGPDGPWASFTVELAAPARSVDQRVKVPALMAEVERLGGRLAVHRAEPEDLEQLARDHDLVVVSAGRASLASVFEVDRARSPYDRPQRAAVLTYLRGVDPAPGGPALRYHAVEGVGECFTCPAVTADGPCDIVVVEAVPGGPLDRWDGVTGEREHLETLESALAEFFEDEWLRLGDGWRLTDPHAFVSGAITRVVRRPVGRLPSGGTVLGMADAVVLNDPLTTQGANNAVKSAAFYLDAIDHHDGPFDAAWMERTFENFWRGWAQWATAWTNAWLQPPRPHQRRLLAAAGEHPVLAQRIAAGFDDARLFSPWWFDEPAAEEFLGEVQAAEKARFDPRDLRRALGQFATGVTVVTTEDAEGRRWGMTANSFTSVSLDPPLVLWAASRSSPSLPAFRAATHFAVNVLAADQHHLSRQFATSGGDKFDGVTLVPRDQVAEAGPEGSGDAAHPPVLAGTVAHFVCRRTETLEAGDHLVLLGEIESYAAPGGEPLVFHSGSYRVATKHPDL